MKFLIFLVFAVYSCFITVQAKNQAYNSRFYASPEVESQSFSLNDNSTIDKEILVGKVLHRVGLDKSHTVHIVWSKNSFKPVADEIRRSLINGGIAPYKIKVEQYHGGFDVAEQAAITARIDTVRLRMQRCNYNQQTYYYRSNDDLGCALNNTIRRSLVNPVDFMF